MSKHYIKIKGTATLIAELSNGKTETVYALVTGYGYLHSCPAPIEGMMDDEWFELEDKTVEVCYPDEFFVKVGDNMWVEQDDGTTIEKILEVIELQDDMSIIEYEEVLNGEYEKD